MRGGSHFNRYDRTDQSGEYLLSAENIKLATYASRCIENEILMHLRKNQSHKNEISIDEPLNIDWDGNELLLSDILGTDPDSINRPIEDEAEKISCLEPSTAWTAANA